MPGNRARNPLVDDAAEDDEDEVEESEEVRRPARVPRPRWLIFPPQQEELDLNDLEAGGEYVENLMEEMDREGHQALLHAIQPVHITVFSNSKPRRGTMSDDRWNIRKIVETDQPTNTRLIFKKEFLRVTNVVRCMVCSLLLNE